MIATRTSASVIENRRIDQRRDRLALHRRDDLRVLDVAPQHRVEVAAALAGQQRRGVDARKQLAVRVERVRQRRAGPHLLVHVVQHRAGTPATSTRRFSRSSDWTSGMPALSSVASSWLKTRNSRVLIRRRCGSCSDSPPMAPLRLEREDVQPLLLELVAQPGFAVGDVHAFDDLARWAMPSRQRNSIRTVCRCSSREICRDYINFGTSLLEGLDRAAAGKGWVAAARSGYRLDEREDARDVVARFGIRRNAAEPLHRRFAGVVGRQRQRDRRTARAATSGA